MPTLQVNGTGIYYEETGRGDPVVLIPGLSIDLTALSGFAEGLSRRHRVISFDNRGAGRSEKPDVPYTLEMMSDDTAGLLRALGATGANVVGFSMGGRIAISLALRHPEQVRSLVLVSTGARVPATKGGSVKFALLELPRRLASLLKKYPQPTYAYRRQRAASRGVDLTGRLREIRVPTLVLHGEKDGLAPLALAKEMAEGIEGSTMKTFKGGHVSFVWRQKELVAEIEEFLSSLSPNSA